MTHRVCFSGPSRFSAGAVSVARFGSKNVYFFGISVIIVFCADFVAVRARRVQITAADSQTNRA